MPFDRAEIQEAFDRFAVAADHGGRTGDWTQWVECFTPDVHYIEHMYGEFNGRQEVLDWITATMTTWPMTHMQEFPWDWHIIDEERGWVVGQVENRFVDPGDGNVYQCDNWTKLVYAGDGLFSSEEDVYNPSRFEKVVKGWLAAWKEHHAL